MRNMTAAMRLHVQQEVVTLASCIKITPSRKSKQPPVYLTEHDKALTIGSEVYSPKQAYNLSAIKTSTEFSSDNTEITLGNRTVADVEGFKNADVYVFYVNWDDLTMGEISLFTGYVTAAELNNDKELQLTVSGIGKKLSKKYLPKYSRTCRTSLGSTKCMVPVLPVGTPDLFFSFPKTYKVGEQLFDRPAMIAMPNYSFAGWGTPVGWSMVDPVMTHPSGTNSLEITNTFARDVALTDGDLILFEANFTADNVTLYIDQLDAAGDTIQTEWFRFETIGIHHVTALVLPDTTSFAVKVLVDADDDVVVTPSCFYFSGALPTARKKLARVTNFAAQDKVTVPNGEFYKDGRVHSTSNPDKLTDWEVTATDSYEVDANVFIGVNTTIEQTVPLPPLGCTLLADGCYFLNIEVDHNGGTTTTVDVLDDEDNVIDTVVFTETKKKIRLDNSPASVKLSVSVVNNEITHVRAYIYNALVSATTDPSEVTLANAGEVGTKNDIWLDETENLNYPATVAVVPSADESRVFNLTAGDLPVDKVYGTLVFVTGPNAGTVRKVRTSDEATQRIEIFDKLTFMPQVGDTLIVGLGCNKSILTCGGVFNNAINFRGEPYMPSVEKLGEIIST